MRTRLFGPGPVPLPLSECAYGARRHSSECRSRSHGEICMPSIVGGWKLVSAPARDAAGAALPAPYDGQPMGRVTFTADGRMMSVVCDGRAQLPSGVSREYSSYCGNYAYDGERLVTR